MPTPAQIINRINADYAALLKNYVAQEEVFSPRYPASEIRKHIFASGGLVVPSQHGNLTPLEHRVWDLLRDVNDFWRERREAYLSAAQGLSSSKVHVSYAHTYLLAFFETIVVSHSLFFMADAQLRLDGLPVNPDFCAMVIRLVRDGTPLLPLLTAAFDPPLVVLDVWGRWQESRQITVGSHEVSINPLLRAQTNLNDLLREISRDQQGGHDQSYWMNLPPERELDLDIAFDAKRMLSLMDRRRMDSGHLMSSEWNRVMAGETTQIKGDHLRFLVLSLGGALLDMTAQDEACTRFHADPHIDLSELYKWKISREGSRLAAIAGLPIEMAAAKALSLPPFTWVKGMTHQDMLHFREIGCAELLRKVFNERRNHIRYAGLDDFDLIATQAQQDLSQIVIEESDRLKKEGDLLKKRLLKSSILFTSHVVLGVITIALPPLLVVSLPAFVWSLIVGGASAPELIRDYRQWRSRSELIGSRPVAFLAKCMES